MEYAGYVAPHAPYVVMCDCAAYGRLHRLSGSSSSGNSPPVSQVVSSIGDGASDVTGVSCLKSVGQDNTIIFKT